MNLSPTNSSSSLVTDSDVRTWYGIQPDAYLPRGAFELLQLARLLYVAWRSWESGRPVEPEQHPPALFFHLATELCDLSKRGNFEVPAHILWPKAEKLVELGLRGG